MGDMILWGISLIGVVQGLMALVKRFWPGLSDKARELGGAALIIGGALLVQVAPELPPDVALWVQRGLTALVAGLGFLGYYQIKRSAVAKAVMSRLWRG